MGGRRALSACSTVHSRGSDDGGLVPHRLFQGVLGTRGSAVSDSGRRHGSFFWVGWEEKAPRPMEFKLCLLPCRTFEHPKFLYYISSLYSGGLAVCG